MKASDLGAVGLFLPADERARCVTLGADPSGAGAGSGGEKMAGAVEASDDVQDPRMVLWFAGGPPEETRAAEEVAANCLRHGGTVLVVWRSGLLEAPKLRSRLTVLPGEDRLRESTYLLDDGRILSTTSLDARGLAGTSKAKLLRRTVRRLVPLSWLCRRGLPRWHLTVLNREGSDGPRLRMQTLLERVSRVTGRDLTLDQVAWIDRTEMGVAVAKLRPSSGESLALQVALDDDAHRRLERNGEQLVRLTTSERFPEELRPTLPLVLDRGTEGGSAYLVTRWLEGVPGGRYMYSLRRKSRATEAGLRWILDLHRHSRDDPADPAAVAEWGADVLDDISSRAGREDRDFSTEVGRFLETALERSPLPTVLGHGDFWLGNLVLDEQGGDVLGVLDWDHADPAAPPLEDVLHLLFFQKGLLSTFDPIRQLIQLVTGQAPRRTRRRIADYWREMDLDPGLMGAAVALYWLRFLDRRELQAPRAVAWYRDNYHRLRDLLAGRTSSVLAPLGDRIVAGRHGRDD